MRSVCSEDSPSSQLKRKLPALEMELGWAGGALGFKKTLLYGGTIEVAMFELKANSYTANTQQIDSGMTADECNFPYLGQKEKL